MQLVKLNRPFNIELRGLKLPCGAIELLHYKPVEVMACRTSFHETSPGVDVTPGLENRVRNALEGPRISFVVSLVVICHACVCFGGRDDWVAALGLRCSPGLYLNLSGGFWYRKTLRALGYSKVQI